MALVGVGLVLIVVRILADKPTRWLLKANAVALAATLYLCCFANFPDIVARYNVAHWLERDGRGPAFDMRCLVSLGPQVLPAFEGLEEGAPASLGLSPVRAGLLRELRAQARSGFDREDWRSWTFRGWRLKRYLASVTPAQQIAAPPRNPRQAPADG